MVANAKEGPVAVVVEKSGNRKLGEVAATLLSQTLTCPRSCPLLNNGCYAQVGRMALQTWRLDKWEGPLTPLDAAREEARLIDTLETTRPMRLHEVGDCPDPESAREVAAASERFMARGGGQVWTYTHAWRDVPRENWGNVSVLASCETMEEAVEAMSRGYAAAIVTPEHPEDGRAYKDGDNKVIPCANQTRGVQCKQCKLCFNDKRLLDGRAVIAFEAHGARKKTVKKMLQEKSLVALDY